MRRIILAMLLLALIAASAANADDQGTSNGGCAAQVYGGTYQALWHTNNWHVIFGHICLPFGTVEYEIQSRPPGGGWSDQLDRVWTAGPTADPTKIRYTEFDAITGIGCDNNLNYRIQVWQDGNGPPSNTPWNPSSC